MSGIYYLAFVLLSSLPFSVGINGFFIAAVVGWVYVMAQLFRKIGRR
ncbi:MAG: hypothetical protein Q4B70_10595 [Lachnospiraceae bacterium]|nr:hypothetical protein [Lachnospiraceae bacterium]